MWKYTSYLKKGLSHEKAGTKCQDSVLVREDAHCIVAALADGLGSLKYSDVAAATATRAVCDLFTSLAGNRIAEGNKAWKQAFAKDIVDRVTQQIHAQAETLGVAPATMDCTLVFAYISKDHNYAITGRLGDSAICVIAQDGAIAINDGNQSANGTSAVLDKDAHTQLEISFWDVNAEKIYGFILTSDGLDNELYRKGSTHVNKAAEGYFNAVALSADPQRVIHGRIMELTRDPDSAFDDDISIAVISRATAAVVFPEDPTWLCTCGARNRLQDTYCCQCGKDFSILYQNVRFKEYGGKAAFFQKINKNPQEEAKLLGLNVRVAPTPPVTPQPAPGSIPKPRQVPTGAPRATANPYGDGPTAVPPAKSQPQQSSRKLVPLMLGLCAAGLVVGIIFGSTFAKIGSARKISELKEDNRKLEDEIDRLQEEQEDVPVATAPVEDPTQATDDVPATEEPTEATEPSQEPTEPEDPTEGTKEPEDPTEDTKEPEDPTEATDGESADTVPEDILWDEEGVYYWGETEDGKPHGQGICLIDGYYYIGQFDQGQRDGTFLIVAAQDPEKTLTLTWEDGQIDPEDSHLEEYAVRTKTLKVYTKADKKAEVLTELKKDDVVYKTHTQAVVAGAQKWIQVICGDTIGWVPMDSLIPKAK